MKNGLEYIFLGLLRILIKIDAQHFFFIGAGLYTCSVPMAVFLSDGLPLDCYHSLTKADF